MRNQRIFKIRKKKKKFVTIQNSFFDIPTLSFKSKGVLCSLLSKPEDWQLRTAQLANSSTDGKTAVLSAIKELIEHGYIRKEWLRDDIGQFMGYIYFVFEDPNQNEEWVNKNKENKDDATLSGGNATLKGNCKKKSNPNPKGDTPPNQNSQDENSNPPETGSSTQSDDQEGTNEPSANIPPSDKPTSGNQISDKPMPDNQAHTNTHSTFGVSPLQKHTPTNAGEGELVFSLRNTMQVLCNLRHDQVDSVCSWLKDNPDKLKSFNQWFYKNITLKFFDKDFVINTSAGFSWAKLKEVLEGEITIPRDDSKNEVDLFYRLKYKELEPDPEGLKQIADLFKDSELNKYASQGGRQ